MNLVCRTGTVAFVLALAAMMVLPAAARAAETSSVVNHGWKIVWGDGSARMIHVETGMEVELYLDEKGETEEDGYVNFEMLSVVGPVLSYSVIGTARVARIPPMGRATRRWIFRR